jgi:uncharacterized protein (TIGR03067 family)
MMLRPIAVVGTALLAALSAFSDDKPRADLSLLQGKWNWDPAAKQSDALPQILLERVVIKGNSLTFHKIFDGKRFTTSAEITLYPGTTPKRIDFTPKQGGNKGKTYFGLYEISDGKLRVCYRGPGSTRPKNFDDKKDGNDLTVFIALKHAPVDD